MYTQKEIERITELFNGIEENKAHEFSAPTYKDSPALKEMASVILKYPEDTAAILAEKIPVLWYLGKCYDEMCRAGMAVKYHKMLLECHAKLSAIKKYSAAKTKQFEDAFYSAVKARNWYVYDDCADLFEIVKDCIPEKKLEKLFKAAVESRKGLPKSDPVELTEEYLAVIDKVEELIDKNQKLHFCHEYWSLKANYLEQFGIHWLTPVVLNPGVMFD